MCGWHALSRRQWLGAMFHAGYGLGSNGICARLSTTYAVDHSGFVHSSPDAGVILVLVGAHTHTDTMHKLLRVVLD